mmetsp:Transcript_66447/g.152132  ORF Transcript_66447/g.152132 Transcript_66447/m.152132 type:complete len:364 (-) Transcript_66447:749-1840(-)
MMINHFGHVTVQEAKSPPLLDDHRQHVLLPGRDQQQHAKHSQDKLGHVWVGGARGQCGHRSVEGLLPGESNQDTDGTDHLLDSVVGHLPSPVGVRQLVQDPNQPKTNRGETEGQDEGHENLVGPEHGFPRVVHCPPRGEEHGPGHAHGEGGDQHIHESVSQLRLMLFQLLLQLFHLPLRLLKLLGFSDLIPLFRNCHCLLPAGIKAQLGLFTRLHCGQVLLRALQARRVPVRCPPGLGLVSYRDLRQHLLWLALAIMILQETQKVWMLPEFLQLSPRLIDDFLGLLVVLELFSQQLLLLFFFLLNLMLDRPQASFHGDQYHCVADDEAKSAHKQMHTLRGGVQQALGLLSLGARQGPSDVVPE